MSEEFERLEAENAVLKRQLAQARTLLEPYRFNERFRNMLLHSMIAERLQVSDHEACPYCAGADIGVALNDEMKLLGFPGLHINHTQDCSWLQACLFLAQHEK